MDFFRLVDVCDNDEERELLEKFSALTGKYPDCVFVILHHYSKASITDVKRLSITKIMGGTAFAAGTATKIYLQQVSDGDNRRVVTATTRSKGKSIEPTYLDFDPNTLTSTLGVTVRAETSMKNSDTKAKKTADLDASIFEILAEHADGIAKWTLIDLLRSGQKAAPERIEQLISWGQITAKITPGSSHAKLLFAAPVKEESTNEFAVPIEKGAGCNQTSEQNSVEQDVQEHLDDDAALMQELRDNAIEISVKS